jgi:hypothetical protein
MMMIGMTAAAKIAVSPATLYQAAMELSVNATINASVERLKIFLIISGINIFIVKKHLITVYYNILGVPGSGGSPSPNRYP